MYAVNNMWVLKWDLIKCKNELIYLKFNSFESPEPLTISCSTKVCSFGNQVVEKVEVISGELNSLLVLIKSIIIV